MGNRAIEVENFAKLVSNLKYEISSKAPFAASVGTDNRWNNHIYLLDLYSPLPSTEIFAH